MESDLFTTAGGLNGINLADYFPNYRSLNTVVYTHKRFLKDPKEIEKQEGCKSNLKVTDQKFKEKHDKAQQFDGIVTNKQLHHQKEASNMKSRTNTVLNETVKFAKNLVPLVIPPGDSATPVFYTIQTKKSKSKNKKSRNGNIEQDTTYNKAKSRQVSESYKKEKITHQVENSIRKSISDSSQNTLDEIDINESLSCTISDLSEKKYCKREKHVINKCDKRKFAISNSFEALAAKTVDTTDGSKIKICLMNDTDKNIFSKNLQTPIINAIKECISELSHYDSDIKSELKVVQRIIKCNSEKLDILMNKMACIENKLNDKESVKTTEYPNVQTVKASNLDQLSEDLIVTKEYSTEEESKADSGKEKRKFRDKRVVVAFNRNEKRKDDLSYGEEIPGPLKTVSSVTHLGVKLDRPNRIPARFCWTEAASNI